MPEGDTIHYAANRIRPVLAGRVPDQIVTPSARHRTGAGIASWGERLAGRVVRSVDAHGKHLFLRFDGDLTVHSHLRMTGSWGVYDGDGPRRRGRHRAWLEIHAGREVVVQFDGPVLELVRDSRTRFDQ
jgi:endonuclease VIII